MTIQQLIMMGFSAEEADELDRMRDENGHVYCVLVESKNYEPVGRTRALPRWAAIDLARFFNFIDNKDQGWVMARVADPTHYVNLPIYTLA